MVPSCTYPCRILMVAVLLAAVWGSPHLGAATLPADLAWLTNLDDPVFASPKAQKGGTLHQSVLNFPLTFRVVGPDANSTFRSAILDNQLALIDIHPNSDRIIPQLATHWAYGKDKRSMYFKLDPAARWSDGKKVTADDFAFTMEFMRSEHIVAPWYNDFYTNQIEKVVVFDEHTLAVFSTKATPDLHFKLSIIPTPRHFFGKLEEGFVKKYNWAVVPNTGPYQISAFKKGKYVKFRRKKDWWAKERHYFRNRFNVDTVIYNVIRDQNLMWEHFKKGKLDTFMLTFPQYWHDKSKTSVVEKGYVERIWFFNDMQQPAWGLWLNQEKELFKDPNLRYAFAHAMHIEKVIEKVLRNDYFRLEHGYVGYGEYTNTKILARRFDLAKVDHYMKLAGWQRGADGIWEKGGRRFSVTVSYGFDGHTPRLVVLKEEAKKAGIELRLQLLDAAAEYKKVVEKKHEVAWMGWGTSERPQFWGQYHSQNAHKPQTNNITNTDDATLDALIDGYRDSLDPKERIALSRKIQQHIHEIGSYVPTFMVPYARQGYWRWLRLPAVPGTRKSDKDLFDPFNSTVGGLFWFDQKLYDETKTALKRKEAFAPVTTIDETYKQ